MEIYRIQVRNYADDFGSLSRRGIVDIAHHICKEMEHELQMRGAIELDFAGAGILPPVFFQWSFGDLAVIRGSVSGVSILNLHNDNLLPLAQAVEDGKLQYLKRQDHLANADNMIKQRSEAYRKLADLSLEHNKQFELCQQLERQIKNAS